VTPKARRPPMRRIEDYAMIGDCRTAALVGRDGSIDWLCLPRFDGDACFAAILGGPENGRWQIAPKAKAEVFRHYRDGGLVLDTRFETRGGAVSVVDFMPMDQPRSSIVRQVIGRRGRVAMHLDLVLRFDYGITVPWVSRRTDGTVTAVAGANRMALRGSVPLRGQDLRTIADFTIAEGESHSFVLTHGRSHLPVAKPFNLRKALAETERFWRDWAAICQHTGEWTAVVRRSLVTLKGLSFEPTGGIVAAPTTSLPERVGGERNWDYRYCWLRDATFTLLAFLNAGYREEARAWREWLLRAVAGSPGQMQIMYGLAGERRLDEWQVPWLPGFAGWGPVRIGNAAAGQLQLDVYGEIADALALARRGGLDSAPRSLELTTSWLDHLAKVWKQPDSGIWEIRGEPRHFTHSKVMAWVAFKRAADARHMPRELRADWQRLAERIHRDICRHAVDPKGGHFVQAYGSRRLDANLLLLAIVGFLPPDDPRLVKTVAAIEERLMSDGLVLRYETDRRLDGLPEGEGAFLACSFWLADNYCLMGRLEDARALFRRLVALCNDVGLLSEEYDPRTRRFLGNFPQAFSHVALVNTAIGLERAEGVKRRLVRGGGRRRAVARHD
jgi:GH15 family glucan-1,4-alpha-glucosidase